MADSDLILRYLTDLPVATQIAGDDLLHLNQGGTDKAITITSLVRAMIDTHYPVGKVVMFANTTNPNLSFPGTKWARVAAAGSTIRIANDDSDVLATGGQDSVTLTVGQIPAHLHYMSFNTQQHNPGTLYTEANGQHNHGASCGYAGDHQHQGGLGSPGAQWGTYVTGTDNSGNYGKNWTSTNGGHTHPVTIGDAGNHQHAVSIPAHTHLVQGNTNNTGNGQAFSIVNRFIKLAAWQRTA